MPFKFPGWCRGGTGRQTSENHPVATIETAIKRYEEFENFYTVDYSKDGLLGRGHFAEVYRGADLRTGRLIAVKKISRRNQDIRNLRTEISALLKVNGHPNIVELYDVFVNENTVILAMELLGGGELFSRVVNSGAYSERQASKHFKRITEALAYMHHNGIVHRDLKPENLVLASPDPDSEIKISDFGLSKVLGDDQSVMYTVCGTSAYAAPEVGYSSNYDFKVDTWSLGVILFVVLSAYHPFDPYGKLDDRSLRAKVVQLQWDFNDRVWNGMSDSVKDLISRLICRSEDRLDANQVLLHPWIANRDFVSEQPISGYSARNLRQFLSSTAFMDDITMDDHIADSDVDLLINHIEPASVSGSGNLLETAENQWDASENQFVCQT